MKPTVRKHPVKGWLLRYNCRPRAFATIAELMFGTWDEAMEYVGCLYRERKIVRF